MINVALSKELEKCNFSRVADEVREEIYKKCAFKDYGLSKNCPVTFKKISCKECWDREIE